MNMRDCYYCFLVCGLGWLCGCHQAAPPAESVSAKAPVVPLTAPLATAEKRPWRTTIRSQGGLVADESALIGAKVAGRVETVSVELGDFVRQGDVIAELDDDELQLLVKQSEAQLGQARAAVGLTIDQLDDSIQRENSPVVRQERAVLDEAKTSLARLRLLEQKNAVTQADLEASAAAVAVAEARYASSLNAVEEKLALIRVRRAEVLLAQDMLKQAVIRAPFDGLVQGRQVAAGAYLRVGDPVAMLVRIDPLRYRGTVPERYALNLRAGQEVLVHLDGLPEPISTRISRISPAIDEFSRALVFEADLPNPGGRLRSGLFAEAEIVVDTQSEAVAIPETSIVEFAGVEKVWRISAGTAAEVAVRTGRRDQGLVEIVSGLNAGDVIIRRGADGRAGPVTEGEENLGG